MKALRALVSGIGAALARPHLCAVLALCDLCVALVAVAPSYSALSASMSRRADASALARGFDFVAWLDLGTANPGALAAWPWAMAAAIAVGWTWGAVAAGGWLYAAARKPFLEGVGRLGLRFLRLGAIVALVIFGLEAARAALAAPVERFADRSTSETLAGGAQLGLAAVHGLAVIFVLCVSDVAKARIHAQDRRFVLRAFLSASWFALRNPGSTLSVGLAGAALQAGLLFAAGVATDRTLGPSAAGFWLPLLLGQVFVALRIAVRAGTLLALARVSGADVAARAEIRESAAPAAPSATGA